MAGPSQLDSTELCHGGLRKTCVQKTGCGTCLALWDTFLTGLVIYVFPVFFLPYTCKALISKNPDITFYEKQFKPGSVPGLSLAEAKPLRNKEMKYMRKKLLVLAVVLAFVLAAGAALGPEEPSATMSIKDVSQAIGVGPIWGQGVITYGAKTHLFFSKLKALRNLRWAGKRRQSTAMSTVLKSSMTWPESTGRPILQG